MPPLRALAIPAACAAILACGGLVRAQAPTLAEQQARLREASARSTEAQARSRALERAAAGERSQAAQARAQEAAAAERIKAAAADILAAQARIAIVDRALAVQRTRVAERQGPILRLIAALQSLARRPALLGLAQPGSTEDMVHVRAVLGTALPAIEARTADVRAEMERIRSLRATAARAVDNLREGRARLERERVALVRLEAEHRLRSTELGKSALVESDRALALGERARDIVAEMTDMGAAAEVGAALAALPGPLPRPGDAARPLPDRAPYRLPVTGRLVTGTGELSENGVRARGLTFEVQPGAEVRAPAAGRVLFGAPFRDYGRIVILDHGGGWTTLLTGMDRLDARKGQRVAQGAVVGRAPDRDAPRVTVELRRRGDPMDVTRLLD